MWRPKEDTIIIKDNENNVLLKSSINDTSVVEKNKCLSDPCQNGGTCTGNGPDTYQCNCVDVFQGAHCELDINECLADPCKNGGTCVNSPGSIRCECPVGFYGSQRTKEYNECDSNPCQHGGTCVDGVNSFTCQCPVIYTGSMCTIPADKCYSNPCVNGGTCSTLGNEYKCSCAAGFTGQSRFEFEKHFIPLLPVIQLRHGILQFFLFLFDGINFYKRIPC